jgi:hypothetical protein
MVDIDGEPLKGRWAASLASGAMAPAELGLRLGLSEGAMTSLLSMLAQEGKVRICLVETPLGGARHKSRFSPSG